MGLAPGNDLNPIIVVGAAVVLIAAAGLLAWLASLVVG